MIIAQVKTAQARKIVIDQNGVRDHQYQIPAGVREWHPFDHTYQGKYKTRGVAMAQAKRKAKEAGWREIDSIAIVEYQMFDHADNLRDTEFHVVCWTEESTQ